GLSNHDLLWYRAPWPPEEAVRRAGLLPLDKPFRTAFQYQSTMFTAAGLAVQSAGGMKWEDFVRSRLLVPLGMKRTTFTSTEALKSKDIACGCGLDGDGKPIPMQRYPLAHPEPAGSIHSSARDLATWLRFQLNEGTIDGRRIVSAENLGETHRPQMVIRLERADRATHPETVQMSYGLAWVIQDYRGKKLVSHAGIIDGIRCHLTMAPAEKIGIVVLANLHRTRLNQALSNTLVDLLLDLPAKDWNKILMKVANQEIADFNEFARQREAARHHNTKRSLDLGNYTGAYEHPAYGTIHLLVNKDQLVWNLHGIQATLEHYEFDTFVLPIGFLGQPFVRFKLTTARAVQSMVIDGVVNAELKRTEKPGRW
ncbi:MAG: serine hydrolase, partial [Candidatus Acidiferrum sp.]